MEASIDEVLIELADFQQFLVCSVVGAAKMLHRVIASVPRLKLRVSGHGGICPSIMLRLPRGTGRSASGGPSHPRKVALRLEGLRAGHCTHLCTR